MEEDYIRIFSQTAIADCVSKEQKLIGVKKMASVEELLMVLYNHSLSSVPVIDTEIGKGRVIGFVDTNDVLALLVKLCEKIESPDFDLRLLSIAFLHTTVSNIMDLSKKDEFTVVLEEQSLMEILKLYAKGVHRVALLSVFSDIEDIVSQSNVIRFLSDNLSVLGPLETVSIGDLLPYLVQKESVVVSYGDELVIHSLRKMHQNHVTAVPILNRTNLEITGTLSINDLNGLKEDNIDILLKTTNEFLGCKMNHQIEQNKNKPSHPVILKLDNTFRDAIQMLAQYKIHRIWVVDDFNRPISIVSLTDVCSIITNPPTFTTSHKSHSPSKNNNLNEDNAKIVENDDSKQQHSH
eukprot:gene7396-9088_t